MNNPEACLLGSWTTVGADHWSGDRKYLWLSLLMGFRNDNLFKLIDPAEQPPDAGTVYSSGLPLAKTLFSRLVLNLPSATGGMDIFLSLNAESTARLIFGLDVVQRLTF